MAPQPPQVVDYPPWGQLIENCINGVTYWRDSELEQLDLMEQEVTPGDFGALGAIDGNRINVWNAYFEGVEKCPAKVASEWPLHPSRP